MFEAAFTIWLIILLLFPSFGGGEKSRRAERPKQTVATLPSPSPSALPLVSPNPETGKPNPETGKPGTGKPEKIPTPALLPGLIVLLGKVLQKKGEKVA